MELRREAGRLPFSSTIGQLPAGLPPGKPLAASGLMLMLDPDTAAALPVARWVVAAGALVPAAENCKSSRMVSPLALHPQVWQRQSGPERL